MSKDLTRVTITLSERHEKYLDEQTKLTNMTRTSLVQLAIETWMQQKESIDVLGQLMTEVERQRLEEVELLENNES